MKYIATLDHVLEVSLQGTADLSYWRERLGSEGLFPTADAGGRAQIWISGANSKFRGIRFRELSIAIHVALKESAAAADGIFLPQAFNSSRLFTFFERHWFHTPYVHAGVEVDSNPFRICARVGADVLIEASLGPPEQQPSEADTAESWQGPIYLPAAGSKSRTQCRHFFACLAGDTISRPFIADRDKLLIKPSSEFPVLEWLFASGFRGETWSIRPTARHARSKTYA